MREMRILMLEGFVAMHDTSMSRCLPFQETKKQIDETLGRQICLGVVSESSLGYVLFNMHLNSL